MDQDHACADRLTVDRLQRGGNHLLARVPADDLALLAACARPVSLARNAVVEQPDAPAEAALFLENGVVSVIKVDGRGERTELCMVGPEGFCGTALITADGRWPYLAYVQVERLDAIRVASDDLLALLERSPRLGQLLVRAAHVQTVQIAEGLASASWQRLPARLARWLLMYRDRLMSDRIDTTHEYIAMMVGAQRSGITVALHDLEGAGLIAASRGLVVVRDVEGLQRLADGTYGTAEREWARLIGDAPAGAQS